MVFTRNDRRLMKLAVIVAVPVEMVAFYFFQKIPFDYEPALQPTPFEAWAESVALYIHYPAIKLLLTPLAALVGLPPVLFLIGYIDLLLTFGFILAIQRLIRRGSTQL